jgi:hypothetical protein
METFTFGILPKWKENLFFIMAQVLLLAINLIKVYQIIPKWLHKDRLFCICFIILKGTF